MRTVLLFQCEDKKYTEEVIFEIEGFPDMQVGDTFEHPVFSIGETDGLAGEATIIKRHWRSRREDLIIYCSVSAMLIRYMRMHKGAGGGFRADLPKQVWGSLGEALAKKISEAGFSSSTLKALKPHLSISTLGDIVALKMTEFFEMGVGKKVLDDVEDVLEKHGLDFKKE